MTNQAAFGGGRIAVTAREECAQGSYSWIPPTAAPCPGVPHGKHLWVLGSFRYSTAPHAPSLNSRLYIQTATIQPLVTSGAHLVQNRGPGCGSAVSGPSCCGTNRRLESSFSVHSWLLHSVQESCGPACPSSDRFHTFCLHFSTTALTVFSQESWTDSPHLQGTQGAKCKANHATRQQQFREQQ